MLIPFIDLTPQHKEIKKEIDKAIKTVIKKNDFILGEDVQLFEKEFAEFCGCSYAVGVSSGTAALFLALKSIGVCEEDEVIIPSFTFIATAFSVSYTGAKPVFVDIDERTYNIDPSQIKKSITKNTKAIIPVHLFGQPANMHEIIKIAKEHNLKVIEDAAQSHGAAIKTSAEKWRKTGSMGDIACFSFYPTKNMGGMGDAGIITTNNKDIYHKLLLLRNYGRTSKYEHSLIGYNSRLDSLQAAILRIKLKKLNQWNTMRVETANIYNKLLKDTAGVSIPYKNEYMKHIYHAYCIRVKNRDELFEQFRNNRIGTIIYYPVPLHLQKVYASLGYKKGDLPVSEKISDDIISLPIYPHIKEKQVKFVVEIIKKSLLRRN